MGVPEVWFLHIRRFPIVLRWDLAGDAPRSAQAEVCTALDAVSFPVVDGVIDLRFPDGTPFPDNVAAVAVQARADAARAEAEAARADAEASSAAAEVERAEAEAERALAEAAHARAEAGRAGRLAVRLREMGVDPDTV